MKALLVDDASLIRMSLKDILDESNYDFEYLEAGNGSEEKVIEAELITTRK